MTAFEKQYGAVDVGDLVIVDARHDRENLLERKVRTFVDCNYILYGIFRRKLQQSLVVVKIISSVGEAAELYRPISFDVYFCHRDRSVGLRIRGNRFQCIDGGLITGLFGSP